MALVQFPRHSLVNITRDFITPERVVHTNRLGQVTQVVPPKYGFYRGTAEFSPYAWQKDDRAAELRAFLLLVAAGHEFDLPIWRILKNSKVHRFPLSETSNALRVKITARDPANPGVDRLGVDSRITLDRSASATEGLKFGDGITVVTADADATYLGYHECVENQVAGTVKVQSGISEVPAGGSLAIISRTPYIRCVVDEQAPSISVGQTMAPVILRWRATI